MKSKISKICHNCGREILEDAEKCQFCGAVWRNWFVRHSNSIVIFLNLAALFFVAYQILQTQRQIKQTETRYIEDNKPIIDVKVDRIIREIMRTPFCSEGTVDTLWTYMTFANEGRRKAADTRWIVKIVNVDKKRTLRSYRKPEVVDISTEQPENDIIPCFKKYGRFNIGSIKVLTVVTWKWRGYNLEFSDTVGYAFKPEMFDNALGDIALGNRMPRDSAVKLWMVIDSLERKK